MRSPTHDTSLKTRDWVHPAEHRIKNEKFSKFQLQQLYNKFYNNPLSFNNNLFKLNPAESNSAHSLVLLNAVIFFVSVCPVPVGPVSSAGQNGFLRPTQQGWRH